MADPGPWTIEPGESVLWEKKANRTQGARAVGGKLVLTDRRLLFAPHAVDRATGGTAWITPLADVDEAGQAPRDVSLGSMFSGGLAKRLRVTTSGGDEEFFVVRNVAEVAAQIMEAVGAGGSTSR